MTPESAIKLLLKSRSLKLEVFEPRAIANGLQLRSLRLQLINLWGDIEMISI